MPSNAALSDRIAQGRGDAPADLVLKGAQIFDLITGQLERSDVALCGDTIVGVYGSYQGKKEIELEGRILVPGFIDTHLHVESSLLTPFEFDRCVTPHGVTTAICDPHEIANICGLEGINYFLRAAPHLLMDLRVQLSSCVPSTHMETTGARLGAEDLIPLRDHPRVLGLAEFMNFPGVLMQDEGAMAKLEAWHGRHIDGHAPLLRGNDLNGYISAGIRTEHEATTAEEALEKLRKGLRILIREGSVSKDLEALAELLSERTAPYMCLCTDDRNPLDIAEQGHLDYMIRRLIAKGCTPLSAYRAASLSGAEAFGLKDRGLIAPGKRADIVVLSDLERCTVEMVFAGGVRADEAAFHARTTLPPIARHSVKAPHMSANAFKTQHTQRKTSVIGIEPGKIITQHLSYDLEVHEGDKRPDPARDLAKIAVIERHGKNGNVAVGFVQGFGLQRGSIASTVCHDHHNLAVVGVDYDDMALAANRLGEIEGGFVVCDNGKVLAELALPLGGLMSLEPFEVVHGQLALLRAAALSLGVVLDEPFLQLAFLALPVIPHLKITDHGLVDVDLFEVIGES